MTNCRLHQVDDGVYEVSSVYAFRERAAGCDGDARSLSGHSAGDAALASVAARGDGRIVVETGICGGNRENRDGLSHEVNGGAGFGNSGRAGYGRANRIVAGRVAEPHNNALAARAPSDSG